MNNPWSVVDVLDRIVTQHVTEDGAKENKERFEREPEFKEIWFTNRFTAPFSITVTKPWINESCELQ